MRKIVFVFLFILLGYLTSCSVSNNPTKYPGYGNIPENFIMGEYELSSDSTITEQNLTCIAHDDNVYYEAWLDLINEYEGAFNYYHTFIKLKTNNRLVIYTPKDAYVELTLLDEEGNAIYTSMPNKNGVCYLYPNWYASYYNVLVTYFDKDTSLKVTEEISVSRNRDFTLNINASKVEKELIDLMFVVDTTISMGDELEYLKNEIRNVVSEVSSFNNCSVNVSVLLYKDKGEIYETLYSDFTLDVSTQIQFLSNKIAYGGGDFEECVDVAIEEAYSKNWSINSTKILVHIGDAPAHDEDIDKWYNSVLDLCGKGITLITVAGSGTNIKTEYLFRSMTLLTNGTYVALTNDSGLGEDHLDPSIDLELTIEYLDNCLVRLISSYHTGRSYYPIPIN